MYIFSLYVRNMKEYFVYPIICVLRTKGVQKIVPNDFNVFGCLILESKDNFWAWRCG